MNEYSSARAALLARLRERAPGRIQLLVGPRQVGKTTLLLEIARRLKGRAIYAAADVPEAAVPGWWDALWRRAEETARGGGRRPAVLLIDEVHTVPRWSADLKARWDRLRREKIRLHVVATGSASLRVGAGSRESMAGRFERIVIGHWPAGEYAKAFRLGGAAAAGTAVRWGTYPGARDLLRDPARFRDHVRDAIVEPAIGRDILLLKPVRRPALLRQVFGLAVSMPAQIVSLQKIQAGLAGRGTIETVSQYLRLLEEAFLVAALEKHASRPIRRRAAPPKIVVLSNALLAAAHPGGPPDPRRDPERWGRWVENACLAHAWNAGQEVRYWREGPHEVDGVIEGSWGRYAVEVKTGRLAPADLAGLLEFVRRFPAYRPLVATTEANLETARRAGVAAMTWESFLLEGPAGRGHGAA